MLLVDLAEGYFGALGDVEEPAMRPFMDKAAHVAAVDEEGSQREVMIIGCSSSFVACNRIGGRLVSNDDVGMHLPETNSGQLVSCVSKEDRGFFCEA